MINFLYVLHMCIRFMLFSLLQQIFINHRVTGSSSRFYKPEFSSGQCLLFHNSRLFVQWGLKKCPKTRILQLLGKNIPMFSYHKHNFFFSLSQAGTSLVSKYKELNLFWSASLIRKCLLGKLLLPDAKKALPPASFHKSSDTDSTCSSLFKYQGSQNCSQYLNVV